MSRGMPDFNQLMKQAQKLQTDIAKAQDEIAAMTIDGSAGGGMVTATVNGQFDVVKLTIDPNAVDPNDVAMLEDLVLSAVNQANTKMRELAKQKMNGLMPGGMPGMPGMF